MSTIVVTTCTNRKRQSAEPELQARNLPNGDLEAVAAEWFKRVSQAKSLFPAEEMYSGRSFVEATIASKVANSPLFIVSAGLGLVGLRDSLPPYDLTTAKHSRDRVQNKVTNSITSADWWGAINLAKGASRPIARLVRENKGSIVILGLSSSYLAMVEEDLCSLANDELDCVRIVGVRPSVKSPERLSSIVMPYDERFDGPDSPSPGTRGDFASRALRNFCQLIAENGNRQLDKVEHKNLVLSNLEGMRRPQHIVRRSVSDDEVIQLVSILWTRANGSSSKMLRILRDEELIACEQGRFASLFKHAKEVHSLT